MQKVQVLPETEHELDGVNIYLQPKFVFELFDVLFLHLQLLNFQNKAAILSLFALLTDVLDRVWGGRAPLHDFVVFEEALGLLVLVIPLEFDLLLRQRWFID